MTDSPALTTLATLYGELAVPDWQDWLLRLLDLTGEWGAAEVALLAPLVDPGEALWDLGAFLGTFSLGLARHVAPGRVLAVDANAALLPCLEANLRLLPCPATALCTGIGSQAGWIAPVHVPAANAGGTHYAFCAEAPAQAGAVPCCTLAALRGRHGDYDVLKLDLEGMEVDALKGDAAYIADRRPVIWAECNEDLQSFALARTLIGLGYAVTYLGFPVCRRDSFRPLPDVRRPFHYEAALLAAPPGRLARLVAQLPADEVIRRPVTQPGDLRRALFDTPRRSFGNWQYLGRAELIAQLVRMRQGAELSGFLPSDGIWDGDGT